MTKFAFLIHPLKAKDTAKKYPVAKYLPNSWIEWIMWRMSPKLISRVTGIKTPSGKTTEGIFIGIPLTPKMFQERPVEEVYDRLVYAAELARKEGCEILGLGAFTSVVGDGGVTVAGRSNIAVTTGNSYTVATAIEGSLKACEMVGIDPKESVLAVVGATGSIGKTCATVLGRDFGKTIMIGRDMERTEAAAATIPGAVATTDLLAIKEADLIVTVTSSDAALIEPEHLKPGSVVCDVARPRDVSVRVSKERPDVLVIEGGVVSVPGDVEFGVSFGFPPKTAYACMCETMMLALEDRAESFTLGKDVTVEQVDETNRMAERLGFHISGFRSFEKAVNEESIARVREARKQVVKV